MDISPNAYNTQTAIHRPHESQEEGRQSVVLQSLDEGSSVATEVDFKMYLT